MGKFGQDAGVTPLLFFEGHPGIFFNDHRESGAQFNVSSEGLSVVDDLFCTEFLETALSFSHLLPVVFI